MTPTAKLFQHVDTDLTSCDCLCYVNQEGLQVMQDEWKAAAEKFIGKRGYAAAEKLRGSLQMEWQQLKAIRMRCSGVHQVTRCCGPEQTEPPDVLIFCQPWPPKWSVEQARGSMLDARC